MSRVAGVCGDAVMPVVMLGPVTAVLEKNPCAGALAILASWGVIVMVPCHLAVCQDDGPVSSVASAVACCHSGEVKMVVYYFGAFFLLRAFPDSRVMVLDLRVAGAVQTHVSFYPCHNLKTGSSRRAPLIQGVLAMSVSDHPAHNDQDAKLFLVPQWVP